MRRILGQLKFASNSNGIFHLWCHPHNLLWESNVAFEQLEHIFKKVNHYKLKSMTMGEASNEFLSKL